MNAFITVLGAFGIFSLLLLVYALYICWFVFKEVRMNIGHIGESEPEEVSIFNKGKRLNYQRLLTLHPDCRDPDHPGCEHCWDNHED